MISERQVVYRSLFELDNNEAWKLLKFISMIPDFIIKRDSNDELNNLVRYYYRASKIKLGLDFTLITSAHHLDCTQAIDKLQDGYPQFIMRFYDIQNKNARTTDHFIIAGRTRYSDYRNIINRLFPEMIKVLTQYISDLNTGNWEYVYKMIISKYTIGSSDVTIYLRNVIEEYSIVAKDVSTIFFN